MLTKAFWLAAGERAVRTFAQALVAVIGVSAVSIAAIPWPEAFGVAATAAVLSLLTSIAASATATPGPSLGTEKVSE